MKKTLFVPLLAAALFGMVSCGHGDKSGQETDTTLSAAAVDSMSQCYGEFMGAYFNKSIAMSMKYDSVNVDKKEFLKGLQLVLSDDRSEDFVAGANAGLQILHDLGKFKSNGHELDRKLILRNIVEQVLGDTLSELELTKLQRSLAAYSERIEAKKQNADERDAAASPQGVANNNAGKAYASDFKAQSGAVETASGLVALVENPGDGEIDYSQALRANISLRHVNGRSVADQQGIVVMPDGQLPGISEALRMLKAGGKGTFVLPPSIAYGPMGMAEAGIGPMEWMIYEIEVVGNVDPAAIAK